MRLWPSLLLLAAASGCVSVQVPNTKICTVAGVMAAGANCVETLTGERTEMSLDEYLAFLEPAQGELERGGAICQSADDWNAQKTALEQACRALGRRCSYSVRQAIRAMSVNTLEGYTL